ncbi:MAG: hypothetical protein OXU20_24300 [Myxococcales bacterium]|nr:hypothetical protein [Myxococcales bacterium]MDD9970530.1 hypothetical protein [Myxococcales bacterium]
MTEDQARELFSVAVDGDLRGAELDAFERYLRDHPKMAEEFATFRAMIDQTRRLSEHVVVPDLLPGVQQKLRGRGKRGMEQLRGRGFPTTLTLALVTLALAGLLWLAFVVVSRLGSEVEAGQTPPTSAPN